MSMVDSMPWVADAPRAANKHFAIAVTLVPLLAGFFLFISTSSVTTEPVLPIYLSCFDEDSSKVLVTSNEVCSSNLISLGSGAISESATASGDVTTIHPLLLARFNAAKLTAGRQGVNLYITSGYRSEGRQAVLFADAIRKYGSESEAAKWVLPPQFSHHPNGLAIDVNYPGDRAGAKWLEVNGSRFGLCRVYANEWWHFEGVIAPGEPCPAMAPNALVDMR